MAYAYHTTCGTEVDQPSLAEAMIGKQKCAKCGQDRNLDEFERYSVVECFERDFNEMKQELQQLRVELKTLYEEES